MSVQNREIQTVSKVVSSDASTLTIGGQVPSGMKRWVTFIAVDALLVTNTEALRMIFASTGASPTKTSLVLTSNRKYLVDLRASKALTLTPDGVPLMVPRQPNADKPLFSIDSGAYLGVYASSISSNLFIQYYDE